MEFVAGLLFVYLLICKFVTGLRCLVRPKTTVCEGSALMVAPWSTVRIQSSVNESDWRFR